MKKFYLNRQWKLLNGLIVLFFLVLVNPSISNATSYGTNLVPNGDAINLDGWDVTNGGTFMLFTPDGSTVKFSPNGGDVFDFYPSGLTIPEWITYTVNISDLTTDISNGTVKAVLSGYLYRLTTGATSRIKLEQLNGSGALISGLQIDNDGENVWQQKTITINNLSTSARQLRITLYAVSSSYISDYVEFDGIDLKLTRWPMVTNTTASSVTASSVTLGGNVTTDGSPANTERGIVYSATNTNPAIGGANVTKVAVGSGSGTFNTTLTGLSGAQKYYYNAYATNTLGTVYGTVNNFTTLTPTYLTATTNDATSVTINSAVLNGSVNANGNTTYVYFQYGTTASYGTQVAASPAQATGTSATTETVSLTGLLSSTTYHYRMAAYNSTELWKYGEDKTFTTATPVSEIGLRQSSTAIADGGSHSFSDHQSGTNTDIIFTIENTGTKELSITTPISISGSNADQFSIQSQPASSVAVSGNTTFTVRFSPTSIGNKTANISISNDDSDENPYDLTITGQAYLSPTVTTNAVSNLLASTVTLNGLVNANNNSTVVKFQYGTTTSYGTEVIATPSPVTGTSATSVSYNLSGLAPNTLYHYRAVGTNLGGAVYGSDQTFTTTIVEHFTDETTDYAQTFTEGGTTFTMTGYLFDKYEALGGFDGIHGDNYSISNLDNIAPSAGIFGSILNSTNNFYVNNFWIAPGNASYTFGQYGNVIIRGKRSGTTMFTNTLISANTNANYAVNNNYTFIDLSSYNSILIDELEFEVTGDIRYLKIDAFSFNIPATFTPTITTMAVSDIRGITVTGNGNITNLGNPNPTAFGICWGTTASPTISNSKVDKGTATVTGVFSAQLTGLAPNTKYYARAFATNSAGTTYGDDVTFTTLTGGTWVGLTSSDWNDGSNWAGGSVPTSLTDVVIPATPLGSYLPLIFETKTADCNNFTTADGMLEILSSASGTGSLIVHGTASGKVFTDRYFTGSLWHLVAPQVDGTDIGSFISNSSNGISSKVNGATTTYAIADYNEGGNIWNSYFTNTTSGTFDLAKGYLMRGDNNTSVGFYGSLASGTKLVSLTKTGEGWNCIGNPYTSAINMNTAASAANNFLKTNAIDNTNIDPSYCVYVWDDISKTYKVLNNVPGNPRDPGINVFASGQAFFVKANGAASSVQFTPQMQVHSTAATLKSAEVPWTSVTLKVASDAASSTALVYFHEGMTKGLDVTYDAGLLRGSNGLSVYTKLISDNGVDFAIQCLPEIGADQFVIPVGLEAKASGELKFSVTAEGLPVGYKVILEDRAAKSYTDLTNGASYPVSVSANTGGTGRFYLHLSNLTTGTSELLPEGVIKLKAYPLEESIIIDGNVTGNAVASLFASGGTLVGRYNLEESERNSIPVSGLSAGVYILKVVDGGNIFTTKLILVLNK